MNPILQFLLGVDSIRAAIRLLPGLLLAIVVMLVAGVVADIAGAALFRAQGIDPTGKSSPISAVPIAIILGLLLRNAAGGIPGCDSGLKFCTTKILRLGIILVGIKLSFQELLGVGKYVIPAAVVVILSGLLFVTLINRMFGLPPRLGTLIAAGTSICGVSAIVCTAPTIKAEEREVAYAIANVTLFGLLAMLIYPWAAPLLLHSSAGVGMFLGTAIHDTSQVIGAALTYKERTHDELAFKVATITKLARNLFLAVVVPALTYFSLRGSNGSGRREPIGISKLLPAFILGFLLMAVVRTVGDHGLGAGGLALGVFSKDQWHALTKELADNWGARYALGAAMAAVGLSTSFSVFRGVGLRPFAVGFIAAVLVAGVGFGMAALLSPYVELH